jgi:hypothetical protein
VAASSTPTGPFSPRGTGYGAPAQQSVVTLQAKRGASVVIRGADGTVYFAKQLAAGEAYRAPLTAGLTVDVSDPAAFDVYANGVLTTPLATALTPLSRIGGS